MNDRAWAEARLVASAFPSLEVRPADGWARLPDYPVPAGWTDDATEIAFNFPADLPGAAPYAFWIPPALRLARGGQLNNATSSTPPFGSEWIQPSWTIDWGGRRFGARRNEHAPFRCDRSRAGSKREHKDGHRCPGSC